MQNIYEKFEFRAIAEKVASFCRTEVGKSKAIRLAMIEEEENVWKELSALDEMLLLQARYGRLPIDASSDLEKAISFAEKGGTLTEEELEKAASDVLLARSIRQYFAQVAGAPILASAAAQLPHLDFLEKDIHKAIAPDLSIYDGATPKLKGIRIAIARLEEEMRKKLGYVLDQNKIYLSDTNLTIKNGHYVLPVASAYKHKVKGIIQDVSNSGETSFIEPAILVELNNRMVGLRNDEKTEIMRILHDLSQEIAGSAASVRSNNQMIGYLDFLQGKALYAAAIGGHVAIKSEEPLIDLIGASHPLLDPSKAVANDFRLDAHTPLIVISGPNAGGKTVALKTVGLTVLMSQCGLAIPAKQGSSLNYFRHIYCDIGDSQSISDNLSTFSGHMSNIGQILASVGGRDLVLLDELGTGTSPREGEAIALAVVETLLQKHAFTIVSSHFEGLKAFALSNDGLTNASMVFDEKTLTPTYKLKMGLPGESYGLVVAERCGLPAATVAKSKELLAGREEISVAEAVAKLTAVTKATEKEAAALKEKESALAQKEASLASAEAALRTRQEHYLSDVEEKKSDILGRYEKELDGIIRSVRRDDAKLHEVIAAKKRLEELAPETKEETFSGPLAVGDYVSIPSLYASGTVTEIKDGKIAVVSPEGITFKTKAEKAVRTEKPRARQEIASGARLDELASAPGLPLELNLIGLHADEAEAALDKYLDECRLKGFKRVRIIHGWGSGVLRNLVRSYCDSHKDFIASWEPASGEEGGGGATIVRLR